MAGFFVYERLTRAAYKMRACCRRTLGAQLDRRDAPTLLHVEGLPGVRLRFTVHCFEHGHTTVIDLVGDGEEVRSELSGGAGTTRESVPADGKKENE